MSLQERFYELAAHLRAVLDRDPAEAVRQAREIECGLETHMRINLMGLRAATLVDAGALAKRRDAIEEGIALFRELDRHSPTAGITYNLANGLVASVDYPPIGPSWLNHQERTRTLRAEVRARFWKVAQDPTADVTLRTQAWTNLGNQLSSTFRLGEAHDAWLAALEVDPENGVAASAAARNLLWLYEQGGCSDLTRAAAIMLAKIAHRHQDRVVEYAGRQAAEHIAAFARELEDPPPRTPHTDPFIHWVEQERLTLSPAVELIDPELDKFDWLVLPGIMDRLREPGERVALPPVFAMFNVLKSDYILARDLLWRARDELAWPATGRYADTLDYASYGPEVSALILSHRTALDILDKIAATANHYFELGKEPDSIYFSKLWRKKLDRVTGECPLTEPVEMAIRGGVSALYGLAELAEDYDGKAGILRSHKDLRNAATHRFVVLHDLGAPAGYRKAPEVEHYEQERFAQEALRALRVARSAIQMLALAIAQRERGLEQRASGYIGSLTVPDHDWIRGRI
jgi:tetratricopeptide (TPR) repeat protein